MKERKNISLELLLLNDLLRTKVIDKEISAIHTPAGVISSIANGCGKLKTQSIFLTIGALIKIPIAWVLVGVFDSWIGVIVANIIAMGLYCVVQPIWLNRFLNEKELEEKLNV